VAALASRSSITNLRNRNAIDLSAATGRWPQ
jgi:hypothetical protein